MQIEYNSKLIKDDGNIGNGIMITPKIDEDYWIMRVQVSDNQAVVAFPKFGTIGVGFQHEEDWNTNLPYSVPASEIFDHISHNKGSDSILDSDCINAIEAMQAEIPRFITN